MAEIDNRNWNGSGFERPSGTEVDAAMFVATPVVTVTEVTVEPTQPGMKDKLDSWKQQSKARLREYQSVMKNRTSEWKHLASTRAQVMRQDLTERATLMKSDLTHRATVMRGDLNQRAAILQDELKRRSAELKVQATQKSAEIQQEMHEQPGKWAGIATGAGLVVGMLGRMMRHRAKVRRHERMHQMPQQIVIIEGSC